MTSRAVARAAAARRLAETSDTPDLDARVLMKHVLQIDDADLIADDARDLSTDELAAYEAAVDRRAAREPVAYITGRAEFWSLEFSVGPEVLIPRPETELVVEQALGAPVPATARVLDLGTGSGAILCGILSERAGWTGVGVDLSPAAARRARANVAALGLADRARIGVSDWDAALEGTFDLIVSNPPYIGRAEPLPEDVRRYEPASALFAEEAGLAGPRAALAAALRRAAPGASVFLEIGSGQGAAALALAAEMAPAAEAAILTDLAGLDRILALTGLQRRL